MAEIKPLTALHYDLERAGPLQELLAPVPVLPFPWIRKPADDRYVVEIAEECGLGALVADRAPPG